MEIPKKIWGDAAITQQLEQHWRRVLLESSSPCPGDQVTMVGGQIREVTFGRDYLVRSVRMIREGEIEAVISLVSGELKTVAIFGLTTRGSVGVLLDEILRILGPVFRGVQAQHIWLAFSRSDYTEENVRFLFPTHNIVAA